MRKRYPSLAGPLALFAIIIFIAGCRKDDRLLPLPEITENGIMGGKDTITVGDKLVLHPRLNNRHNTTYQWQVNGQQTGADSTFSFTTDSAGEYTVKYTALNPTGQSSMEYRILVLGKYEGGILLVNEGWFGHEDGNVNFYRYGRDTIEKMVYHKENPGKKLGTTTQSGAVFNGRLYLVSKQGPFVVADAKSLKETGRIAKLPADGRAFLGVSSTAGLVSTANGLYRLTLSPLAIGAKVSGISGETGTMRKEGSYIFVMTQSDGALVLRQSDYSIVKKIPGMKQGLAKTADGSIWMGGGNALVKVNPATLATTKVTLPFTLGDNWFAWNEGTITASTKGTAVFIAKTMPWGAAGNEIYRYVPGNSASLNAPIAKLPAGKEFYGAGVRYDPTKGKLVVTAVQSGYGQNYKYNSLYIYSVTGTLEKTVSYEHFYFPALPLFN